MAPGLAFTLGVEQQVQGDIRLCQLIPEVVEHRKAVMVLQPVVGCGDQQINVGVGSGLSWGHSAGCDRLCQETLDPALVAAGGDQGAVADLQGKALRPMAMSAALDPPTLDELRRLVPTLQGITAAHGALHLQVFGSVVHGSAGPGHPIAAFRQREDIRHTGGLV